MTAPGTQRWLFGPAPDLLLGCGLLYMAIFALAGWVGSSALEAVLPGGLLVMVAAIPHYGATLLRVYDSPEDRRKYTYFTVHASLLLAVLFVVGLHSVLLGSAILTVYLTWSPWHYTGQNYGVFLILLRRRGVAITPLAKRFVYTAFMASYVLTFLAIHGAEPQATYAPVTYQGTAFSLIPLGLPSGLVGVLMPATAGLFVGALAAALVLLLREGRLRDLAPSLLLMGTQSLWFAVPVSVRYWGLADQSTVFSSIYTAYGFIWVAFAHSIQYLWVTTYYAKASRAESGNLVYLGKTVLAGYAIWVLPGLLFAPGLLGTLPYESGLALQVAAIVNLHHFVLDGAIWKLRDGRIARVLLRSDDAHPEAGPAPAHWGRWMGRAVWAGGALALVVSVVSLWEGGYGQRRGLASGEISRAWTAAKRLRWVGREGPAIYREIGQELANRGRMEDAQRAFRKSLDVYPTAETWLSIGRVHEAELQWQAAADAYERVLELDPDRAAALYRAALAWLQLGRPERASERLERAVALAPDQPRYRLGLERAQRALARGERDAPES